MKKSATTAEPETAPLDLPLAPPVDAEASTEPVGGADDAPLPDHPYPGDDLPVDPTPGEQLEAWAPGRLSALSVLAHANGPLIAACARVMLDLETIRKGSRNDFAKYAYASVDDFMSAVRPLMAANGLVPVLNPVSMTPGAKHLTGEYELLVVHVGGGVLGPITVYAAAGVDLGPQAYGGVQGYALKFGLRGLFLVAAEEPGEDVDAARPARLEQGPPQRRQQAPAARTPQRSRGEGPRPAGQAPGTWQDHQQRNAGGDPALAREGGEIPGYVPSTGAPAPEESRPDFDTPLAKLKKRLRDAGTPASRVCTYFAVESIDQLSEAQIVQANKVLDEHAGRRSAPAREPGEEG